MITKLQSIPERLGIEEETGMWGGGTWFFLVGGNRNDFMGELESRRGMRTVGSVGKVQGK